ncbi:MAG: DUF4139 domain-containing protein [Desulfobacterales bacterium]|nr:DUF4139 domain-containing protein [Desulfobacterales bacterium]
MKKSIQGLLMFAVLAMPVSGHAREAVTASHMGDRSSISVTVYNNNRGLVRDVRRVQLPVGAGELRFEDVAAHINPVTVRARSTTSEGGFTVIEQNYEYDLMDADKLLDKYVGKEIKIIDPACSKQTASCGEIAALLLSNNRGQVFKIDGKIYLGYPGIRVLPKLPEALIATPTLTWKYHNRLKAKQALEVTYLTREINWKADYVLALNRTENQADLSGWVTIDNKSGATYRNAGLKLVAGSPHAVENRPDQQVYAAESRLAVAAQPAFRESELFEYHVYNLQGKTDLKHKQTKQIKLLDAAPVKVVKKLEVRGLQHFYWRPYGQAARRVPVVVYIQFDNTGPNKLGRPLPAGIVRLYKADTDDSYQFIGEDRIVHTPKKETVKLRVGEAFDVVAERIQTAYRKISTRQHESAWKITLKNRKNEEVVVNIIESLPANWRILEKSHAYEKTDAFTVNFSVPVPRGGEVACSYRVRAGR